MKIYHIAVIVGSLRKHSLNKQLAHALSMMGPPDFSFEQLTISDLPLYNQDDDNDQAASVKRFKNHIKQADGLLFVSAEYNRSIPGVLKNAIDHASRPYGDNAWQGKAGGIIGVSIGSLGTALAQQHLRNVLAYLDVACMGQPEAFIHAKEGLFNADGSVGEASRHFLTKYLESYCAWIKSQSASYKTKA